jgi:hypothetical protein
MNLFYKHEVKYAVSKEDKMSKLSAKSRNVGSVFMLSVSSREVTIQLFPINEIEFKLVESNRRSNSDIEHLYLWTYEL